MWLKSLPIFKLHKLIKFMTLGYYFLKILATIYTKALMNAYLFYAFFIQCPLLIYTTTSLFTLTLHLFKSFCLMGISLLIYAFMIYNHFFRNTTGVQNKGWVYCDTVKERNHTYGTSAYVMGKFHDTLSKCLH
jgi:hypothetical protein